MARERNLNRSLMEALLAVFAVQAMAAMAVLSLHRLEGFLARALPFIIAIAVGVLLGTGAAHLLPESVEALGNRPAVWIVFTLTILVLFAFERGFQRLSGVSAEPALPTSNAPSLHAPGQHGHLGHRHGAHDASRPATLLLGSITHSLVDGASVSAAFIVDARLGWIAALAVGLHEVPHRLGDFALLVHMGLHRGRAALLAVAAGGSALLGWAIVVALAATVQRSGQAQGPGNALGAVAWLLPISAGSFLYIAMVDLLPELQSERRPGFVLGQVAALALGVALALGLTLLPGA